MRKNSTSITLHYTKGYIPTYKKVNSKQFAVNEKLQSKSIVSSWYTEQIWCQLKYIALADLVAKKRGGKTCIKFLGQCSNTASLESLKIRQLLSSNLVVLEKDNSYLPGNLRQRRNISQYQSTQNAKRCKSQIEKLVKKNVVSCHQDAEATICWGE